jgi:hypothetical protein
MTKCLKHCIGVDTGKSLSYTCVVHGREGSVNFIQNNIVQLLAKHGAKIPHYNEISKEIRKKTVNNVKEIIIKSKDISFLIFEHKKPPHTPNREYYLEKIPHNITGNIIIPKREGREIIISLDVHNDFRVSGINDSIHFVEAFVKKMSRKINKDGNIGFWKKDDIAHSNFKFDNTYFKIKGRKCQKNDSKTVVLADLVLGYDREFKPFGKKIKYIKI